MQIQPLQEMISRINEVAYQHNHRIDNKKVPKDAEKITKVAQTLLRK